MGYLHARVAVYGYNGSNNTFIDIDAHGMSREGFQLGKQTAVTMTDVNIIGNGFAGIDMDTAEVDDSWSGTSTFTRIKLNWNGCAENYPVDGAYNNCVDQNASGYGDAWGSPDGGTGGSFTFVDSEVFNTSDGIDLLHASSSIGTITVERVLFEGNVGNALKIGGGDNIIRNSVFIANCNWWEGQSFIETGFTPCRASGNPIVIDMGNGANFDAVNNSITGESDILFEFFGCTTGEVVNIENNVIHGFTQWNDAGDKASWIFMYSGCVIGTDLTSADYNVIYNVKEASPCAGHSNCSESDPLYVTHDYTNDVFDLLITAGSPAVGAGQAAGTTVGQTTVPSDDYRGLTRDANVDLGAYEFGASSPPPQAAFSGIVISGGTIQ